MSWQTIRQAAGKLYQCEQGAEGMEKLLIVGAIVLPLLGVLIFFREKLVDLLESAWGDVDDDMQQADPNL
jgi:hypothetical protein